MDSQYLMGIDTGTTYTKVGIFDLYGNRVILKKSPTPLISGPSGEAEFNAEEVWRNLVRLIQEIPSDYLRKVKAVSISSFAETVYPLDSQDRVLDNGIAWFDRRTTPQDEKVKELLGTTTIRKITGLFPSWIYSLNKILWFKETKPELYEKVKIWLDNAGYIIFKLSGEKIIDYSLACRTMMFDVWGRKWSKKILESFDIDPETLPQPVQSGKVVGRVSKKVSRDTGLEEGTLVVSGGHDHLCAGLSVGVIEEGKILDSTGTTECILFVGKSPKTIDEAAIRENFVLANHVVKDTFCFFQGMYCGGLLLDWFMGNVLKVKDYDLLKGISYKSDNPFFIPYLRGSDFGIMSGALLGLKDFHNRENIICSITETIAFELKKMVESLEKVITTPTQGWVLRSVGGGAQNRLLLECKANLLKRNVEVPENQEATCQGAALLAGIGAGLYRDGKDAVEKTFRVSRVYTPDPRGAEKIEKRYQKYCQILTKYAEMEKI